MKYLLILSCLLFTSVGWSKDISLNDLIVKDGLYYEKFTEKPFTGNVTGIKQGKIRKGIKKGKWIEYWESGSPRISYTIKRGNLHGEYLKYYEDGQLQTKANYKKGKLKDEYEEYYDNGELKEKVIYKNGEIIETIKLNKDLGDYVFDQSKYFSMMDLFDDEDGGDIREDGAAGYVACSSFLWFFIKDNFQAIREKKEIELNELNLEDPYTTLKLGRNKVYWIDVDQESKIIDNQISLFAYADEMKFILTPKRREVLLKFKIDLKKNIFILDMLKESWSRAKFNLVRDDINGTICELPFKQIRNPNGKEVDYYIDYYEDGQIKMIGNRIDGKEDGEWLNYYSNGQLRKKGNYKYGKGEWSWYDPNGQLIQKGNYKDDKLEGEFWNYFHNGQVMRKGNYYNDKKVGEWLNYNKNGQLETTEIWKDGKLIDTITP